MTTWLTVVEASRALEVTPRRIRQLVEDGSLVVRRALLGFNANAAEISLDSLPPTAREKHLEQHPELRALQPVVHLPASAETTYSYAEAPESIRARADLRLEAVRSYNAATKSSELFVAREEGLTLGAVERNWLEEFQRSHPEFSLSIKSVRRWTEAFRRGGLPALLDGNDGSARRGKYSIQREALHFFLARYLDKDATPTIARAIRDTRLAVAEFGWELPVADDPFYRFAKTIPKAVRLARRDSVDNLSVVMPFVARGMDVPYRTLQSDHHIADVFVSCEGEICGAAGCQQGHRPWWTPMYDIGSRKIISWKVGLEVPNSTRILEAFKVAVEIAGLPERAYIDNGKDFQKAFGYGVTGEDESFLAHRFKALGIQVVFARKYNAQAKAIERLFCTFVTRVWQGSEAYVGKLGKRTKHSNYLAQHPELLPTFTDFCRELEAEICAYHHRPHSGTGMRGRTPAEVFASERIPRRDPDPIAFALVFFRREVRVLDRNGVRVDNLTYWPDDAGGRIHVEHFSERVIVLIDPADISRAVLCTQQEEFLCEARVLELATHDSSEAVTQQALDRVEAKKKELRRQFRSGDQAARMHLQRFYALRPRLLRREQERLQEEERRLVVAGSDATTVVLPRFSKIARDIEASRDFSPLSAADRELAAQVPDLTEERLDELLAQKFGRPMPATPLRLCAGESEEEERERVERERRRIRALEKETEGLCGVDYCEKQRTRVIDDAAECGQHWLLIHAQEIENDLGASVLKAVRCAIEKEESE